MELSTSLPNDQKIGSKQNGYISFFMNKRINAKDLVSKWLLNDIRIEMQIQAQNVK